MPLGLYVEPTEVNFLVLTILKLSFSQTTMGQCNQLKSKVFDWHNIGVEDTFF